MRKLIFAINTTLNGCCDHTKFNADEETLDYFTRLTRETDTFVYRRKTYQLMVPYWLDVLKDASGKTKADIEFAQAFDAVNKVVFSQSIDRPAGEKTRIVHTGLQEEVLRLKQEQGKPILAGGVNIPSRFRYLN